MNIVQPIKINDGSDIDRIMNSLSNFTATDRDCVRELWDDFRHNGNQSSYQFCICRDDLSQEALGFACFGKHALTENTYDLYWIAVNAANQRSGAGSDLLFYVEEQVLAQSGRRLIIETSSTGAYEAARNFYRRHGYLREAVIRNFYAPGDHLVIYTKDLIPPTGGDTVSPWAGHFGQVGPLPIKRGQRRTRNPG
jgi:ribosomal protein S18 acetylase RimI-like enzyme